MREGVAFIENKPKGVYKGRKTRENILPGPRGSAGRAGKGPHGVGLACYSLLYGTCYAPKQWGWTGRCPAVMRGQPGVYENPRFRASAYTRHRVCDTESRECTGNGCRVFKTIFFEEGQPAVPPHHCSGRHPARPGRGDPAGRQQQLGTQSTELPRCELSTLGHTCRSSVQNESKLGIQDDSAQEALLGAARRGEEVPVPSVEVRAQCPHGDL